MSSPLFIDLTLGVHLLFVVVGMGPALYFDLRSVHKMATPLTPADVEELHRIHAIVSAACIGLWITGACLIWVRTGFDLNAFSPKLWAKVIVVSTLTLNAGVLSIYVVPEIAKNVGSRLVDIRGGPSFPTILQPC